MPTDARQVAEDYAKVIEQRDRALELLEARQLIIEGWKLRLKETNEQWIKETNENRDLHERLNQYLTGLEVDLVARTQERDDARNDAEHLRKSIYALEARIEELKRGLDLTHKAWEADRLLWEAKR